MAIDVNFEYPVVDSLDDPVRNCADLTEYVLGVVAEVEVRGTVERLVHESALLILIRDWQRS